MWIKDWFIAKEAQKAMHYNMFLDSYRDEDGLAQEKDGYRNVKIQQVIGESEKAVHVEISTGDVDGSYKGWKTWIPKSLIMEEN